MREIVTGIVGDFGAVVRLAGHTGRAAFRRPFERELWFEQAFHLGVQSLTITNVMAVTSRFRAGHCASADPGAPT